MPRVLGNASCPDLQSAISEVEQSQLRRRSELQAKIYRLGDDDDVVVARPLKEQLPKADQNAPTKADMKGYAKYKGTVMLDVIIGIDGTIAATKIVRSATPT